MNISEKPNQIKITKGHIYYHNKRYSIVSLLLFGVGIYFLIVVTAKSVENYRLKSNGKEAKAVIVSKQKVGAKGTIELKYEFAVKGTTYRGSSTNDDELQVSDSIRILYLEDNPATNRSYSFLKE